MHLIIVRRGHEEKFRFLIDTFAERDVRILWDRRRDSPRELKQAAAMKRRSAERRRRLPDTWANLDFLVATASPDVFTR
jgi:hypothetical protein